MLLIAMCLILNAMEAITFPFLQVTTLNGDDVTLPDALVTVEEGKMGGVLAAGSRWSVLASSNTDLDSCELG